MYGTLISVDQLNALRASGKPCIVFDCSFELTDPGAGDRQYQAVRIAGALRADLDRHLSAQTSAPETASGGRHPLPTREAFAKWLGSVGLGKEMQAVVYDRQGVIYCGRLWWMLKWVGHEAVAVLDGGLQAWQAGAGATESGPDAEQLLITSTPSYPLTDARAALASTETIVKNLGRPAQTLIDARGELRFRGEVEPLDPVAGHIPGALNRPFGLNFDASGKFKPVTQLRSEFEALLGRRDPATVVHHCGSGVSAVPNLIAMELAGLGRTALYAGSWSEWCRDPARPVAQG